ncbi:MAG: CAP domain-containing protein [bacterium]|nr:CAP domain-containing protein [bacterium]
MMRFRRLKHYLIPHAGNRYKPGVFLKESVMAIVLVLFLVEGVYVFATPLLIQKTGFTAAVLPAALTDLTNHDRIASGNSILTQDPLLAQAAQKKADDMAAKSYFAHVSPDGKTPWYWLDSVGYTYSYAGENLAVNFTDSMDVETAWMNSPEHHANIVKPEYTRVGIGTSQGTYKGEATTFVVQLFATPAYAETAPVVASAAAPAPSRVPASPRPDEGAAPAQDSNAVLGAQVENVQGNIAAVASSPNHVMTWALGAFAALVTALFAMAIFVKRKRTQHLEVLAGGAVLIGLVFALMFFNGSSISSVQLPRDSQSASVSLAL